MIDYIWDKTDEKLVGHWYYFPAFICVVFSFYSLQAQLLQGKSINKFSRKLIPREKKGPFAMKLFFSFFKAVISTPQPEFTCKSAETLRACENSAGRTGPPSIFRGISFVSRTASVNWIVQNVRQDWRKQTNVDKKINHYPHVQGLEKERRGLGNQLHYRPVKGCRSSLEAGDFISLHFSFLTCEMEILTDWLQKWFQFSLLLSPTNCNVILQLFLHNVGVYCPIPRFQSCFGQ